MLNLDYEAFEKLTQIHNKVFMFVHANWCGSCTIILPLIEELESRLGSEILFVDMDFDQNKAWMHQLDVGILPAVILFKDAKKVAAFQGTKSKKEYLRALEDL